MKMHAAALVFALALGLAACGGGGGGTTGAGPGATPTAVPTTSPSPVASPTATPLATLPLALNLSNLPGQFYGEIAATFSGASPRGLLTLPNGDLLVGTGGGTAAFPQSGKIYLIPNAEAAIPAPPTVFATLTDGSCNQSAGTNTNGIAFAPAAGGGTIFVGMECSVWKIPYLTGDRSASAAPVKFVDLRAGAPPIGSDKDVHHTTSVLVAGSTLYVSVGSSCNACIEVDPMRATIQKTDISTASLVPAATRVRNALALAYNPATGNVWAGGAGQDCMVGASCFGAMDPLYVSSGHPYEWLDPLTTHAGVVDYMWPWCEENKTAVAAAGTPPAGTNCATMPVASVRGPAYGTIMGATFYAPPAGATYAFPAAFKNGLFFTLHGSWHESTSGVPVAVPQVAFVPMTGDAPANPMDWSNGGAPLSTWARNGSGNPAPFMNGFQNASGTRLGRPAGIAVGISGSLFVADDTTNAIYRIRPGIGPASSARAATGLGSTSRR